MSYVRNVNVQCAPYDWRQSVRGLETTYFPALAALIAASAARAGRPVALATLSYGAPVSVQFLASQSAAWRAKNVHSLTLLSGALGGSIWAPVAALSTDEKAVRIELCVFYAMFHLPIDSSRGVVLSLFIP